MKIVFNTFATMFFLFGLGLGIPGIAYSKQKSITMIFVVLFIFLEFIFVYFTR